MRNLFSVLPFVALTFFCWGMYGPILHEGQYAMGADGVPSSLRRWLDPLSHGNSKHRRHRVQSCYT